MICVLHNMNMVVLEPISSVSRIDGIMRVDLNLPKTLLNPHSASIYNSSRFSNLDKRFASTRNTDLVDGL